LLLVVLANAQRPYVPLRYVDGRDTEYCSLVGCTQRVDGGVASPKGNLTAEAVAAATEGASNVTALNQSLFTASGCSLDATDCIVYAKAGRTTLTGATLVMAVLVSFFLC
jgi:hypothetical protein